MRRFRRWRRRPAALALASVTATTLATTVAALAATGPATAVERGGAALDAGQNRVGPDERVRLQGYITSSNPSAGPGTGVALGARDESQAVRIQFRALGAESWRDVKRTESGRRGRFSERLVVSRSGRFRALGADARTTPAELIIVKSKTSATLGGDTAKLGERVEIRGHVVPAGSRRKVVVRVGGDELRTRTSRGGGFAVEWKATETGTSTVRVRADGDKIAAGSADVAGDVTVLRPAVASYYGPGLYGNPLGCGGILGTGTVGVAHKSLPCGTKLVVAYGNRSVETTVIDRGPYVAGREFDLTEALRNELGFGSTGIVYVSK